MQLGICFTTLSIVLALACESAKFSSPVNAAQPVSDESVRAELVRLNKETGLALAFYGFNAVHIVTFKKRGTYEGKPLVRNESGGEISPDGTQISLEIGHYLENGSISLGIIRPDGSNLREYPDVSPSQVCWSHDHSKLAMTLFDKAPYVKLAIFDIDSKVTQVVDPRVADGYLTSQCWSPDDKQIVYETETNIHVHEIGKIESRVIAKGTEPTWSPDGNWVAFRDHDTYYAIHPDGQGRKKLFHNHWGRAVSGLCWSPDSRIVAYVRELGFLQGGALDAEVNQLRVRRLEDGSEYRLADGVDAGVALQWITNRELAAIVQSEAAK